MRYGEIHVLCIEDKKKWNEHQQIIYKRIKRKNCMLDGGIYIWFFSLLVFYLS
jgi:hypothetical protein